MMDETILKKVDEKIAQYERDLHKEKYQCDIHNLRIRNWSKNDEKFIATTATEKIFEQLKTDNCVLVVGRSGSGKSSIVRHIALKLRSREQYEIIPVVLNPDHILKFHDRKQKQIFIVDDFCGKEIINVHSFDEWVSQIDEILKLINTSGNGESKTVTKVLFATGLNIYNDSIFQKNQLLQKYVLRLSKWPLTNTEKLEMIKNYNSPEAETILSQELKSNEAYFPLLCKIAQRKTADQIIMLFDNLKEFIKQDLIALKESNNIKFCIITLCALLNNRFNEEILNDVYESDTEKQVFKNLCFEFNLELNNDTVKSKIREQLENLEDMYMTKTENYYHFIHFKVYKIALSVSGQIFPHCFIKFIRSSFIAERFCFRSVSTDNREHGKHIIMIDDKNAEKKYFDRLMCDLEQGDTYSTFHNSQLWSDSYRTKFCSYCLTRKHKVSELLKHFNEKNDTENITFADRNYKDYIEFGKPHHFFGHKMRKPLIESSWEGYADIVQMLLEFGCDIDEVDRFGRTALLVACILGKMEVVNVLLIKEANHSLCDENGQSPLFVASRKGYDDIVEALLQRNADVNQHDANGNTPLLVASSESHLNTITILSDKMSNFSKCNNQGQTPIFIASMKGREKIVKYLLCSLGVNVLQPDNEGRSPLFIACREGYLDVVKLLLNKNVNVSQSDWNMRSPLFIASAEGYDKIVHVLLQKNADINQCDEEGMTPLFIACDKGRTEAAKILIENGADLNQEDLKKRTPLYAACRRGFTDIVKILHQHNANITSCNKWGGSPLFAACRQGHLDIVKYLVENGSNVSTGELNETTPLLVARENGYTEIEKYLISKGAEINQM